MSSHIYHEAVLTHGLCPKCPRCREHAKHPRESLDQENIDRLLNGDILTTLDVTAVANLLPGYMRDPRVADGGLNRD